MKKIFALLLLFALLLSLAACGPINKSEVAVIVSDAGDDFLAEMQDALDRAMYIKNIRYRHYDAEGDAITLLSLCDDAIEAGAPALVVNATDAVTASLVAAKAKDAGIPLIFLCNDSAILDVAMLGYEKCYAVNVDTASLYKTLGEKVAEDLLEGYEAFDRNKDGKITYAAFGTSASAVATVDGKLTAAGKPALVCGTTLPTLPTVGVGTTVSTLFLGYDGTGKDVNATPVELILTDDDAYLPELLLSLRAFHLNHEKLVTHKIPLYTVGIAQNAGVLLDSDNPEEKAAYSVMSTIDAGYVEAAALENDDELALATATILSNLFKGKEATAGIDAEYVSNRLILVPYTIYE